MTTDDLWQKMVEDAALAFFIVSRGYNKHDGRLIFYGIEQYVRDDQMKGARAALLAALKAMREPSESMIAYGGGAYDRPSVYMGGPSHAGKRIAASTYGAMLAELIRAAEGHK